ncbi:MAG: histidine phosphatase family protein [Oceanospirillaceae bacterium]|nr:histidine phosphatase family protein [Oceanospirillaceae bacterium]
MPIDLLRHGKTTAGRAYIGSTDVALTELGVEQMQSSIDLALASGTRWDLLVSSPLIRCVEFSVNLAAKLSLELQIEADLAEYHFGDWEGLTALQVMDKYPGQLEAFWHDPEKNAPQNAESLGQFSQRIDKLISSLEVKYAGKHLLLVCHGGVMRYLLSKAAQQPIKAMLNYPVEHGQLVSLCR